MERRTGRTMAAGVLFIAALVFFGYGTSYAERGYKTAFEKAYPAQKARHRLMHIMPYLLIRRLAQCIWKRLRQ